MEDGKKKSFNFLKSIGQMEKFDTYEDYLNKDDPNWEKNKSILAWKEGNLKTEHDKEIWKGLNAGLSDEDYELKFRAGEETKKQEVLQIEDENDKTEKIYSQLFPDGLVVNKQRL